MKLSMNMLAWYLRDYHPQKNINDDSMMIQGLRFLPEEEITSQPAFIYFGNAGQFFSTEETSGEYIIINNLGSLIFHGCNYEELLNTILGAFDFFNAWERELLESVSLHAPLQRFSDTIYKVASNQLVICRLDGPVLAVSGFQRMNDPVWESNVDNMFLHPDVINNPYYTVDGIPIRHLFRSRIVKNVYASGNPVLMKYLSKDNEIIGLFAIKQDDGALTDMNIQIAEFVESFLVEADEFTSNYSIYRSGVSVVRSLLDHQHVEQQAVTNVFKSFNDAPLRFIIIRHEIRQDYVQKEALIRSLRNMDIKVITFIYNESLVVLLSDKDMQDSFQGGKTGFDLRYLSFYTSLPFSDPFEIASYYEQALFVQKLAENKPGFYKCEDYAFDYLIEWLHGNSLVPSLISLAYRTLLDWDAKNGTELFSTLKVFVESGFNIRQSARILNVHENTMKYRIARIKDLTGLTFKDQSEIRYLTLSAWLL